MRIDVFLGLGGMLLSGILGAVASGADAPTATSAESPKGVRYRAGKDVDFEQLLIQGQLRRPEVTVVTGNTDQGTDGLLRLRENFLDKMSASLGEMPQ